MVASDGHGLRVLVDFDSTINDFDGAVIRSLNEKFGSTYVVGDMKTWDFLREMDPQYVQHTWGEDMYQSYRWTMGIPPLDGASDGLRTLVKAGYKPRIVSARNPAMKGWIEDWLRTHKFPRIPVTYTGMSGSKVNWAERYNYGIAIDDAPHHVMDLAEAGIMTYMVSKPYNSHIQEQDVIKRVDSLREAAEELTGGKDIATSGRERGFPLGAIPQTDDPFLYQTPAGYRATGAADPCY